LVRSNILSALQALIILSLLSNGAYSFYVITNSDCEGCPEKLETVKAIFPDSPFTEYELAERETRIRFDEIDEVIGEPYLPMPLLAVFMNGSLAVIVAGGQSPEDWEVILQPDHDGVPLYVEDVGVRAKLQKTISEPSEISRLEYLFTAENVESTPRDWSQLVLPITFAAAIDAVNPCAIGVLLVMLTLVFYGVERQAVLKIGLAFCSAVFATYFLIGLGLIRAFAQIEYMKYATVAFAFILGSLRVVEYFTGERKHLPGSFISRITERLEAVSDPRTAFVAGVVTAALILPCSSAPYFLAVNLLSERATVVGGVLLLGYYNLVIVAPLLAITFMIHFIGVQTMELKLWMTENKRLINLLLGLALVLLSLMTFAGYT
jgi:cytochrome c biogenesis protein CcdA